jgi:hypothetical protein
MNLFFSILGRRRRMFGMIAKKGEIIKKASLAPGDR